MKSLSGVSSATKKDGTIYYRSGITINRKHISLGSYPTEKEAHKAYLYAGKIFKNQKYTLDKCSFSKPLSYEKQICLINMRDNKIYIPNPIYLYKHFFEYYLSPDLCLKFDIDDLFYYSSHKITLRGGHLCVADYGSQISIITRYGIRPYSVVNRDYYFINGDKNDYRRHNIEIINRYYGVLRIQKANKVRYKTIIHVRSNYIVGIYDTEDQAAIAYNKAIDLLHKKGVNKEFTPNYLDGLSPTIYAKMYTELPISDSILNFNYR